MSVNNDWWPGFSDSEYEDRYRNVRAAMEQRGLDALLVYGSSIYFGTDPGAPNLVYLAGYAPGLHGYVVLPREGHPTLLVYVPNHRANAQLISVIDDVRAGNDLAGLAVQRLGELNYELGAVGIVGNFDWSGVSIPVEHYQAFTEALPGAKLEVVTRWYEDLRLVKSAEELALLQAGAVLTDRAHEALRTSVRPGVTDMALHNEVLRGVQDAGGKIPFGHVGSTPMRQPAMRYPNFYPVNRVIQPGDVVLTEIAAGYGTYFGKIFGTLFVGPPTAQYRQMFEVAAEIYDAIYAALTPGMQAGDVESVLDGRASETGYRSLSYISGWSTYNTPPAHSRPSGADADMELRTGQCLAVVSYVVNPDNEHMGIWLGDTAVVSDTGLRSLHTYRLTDIDYVTVWS